MADSSRGVTQYIGARYVPIFADPVEWDNTRAYEPLTIVLHNGSSYTSKQSVPPGTDISNTSYWVATGNYNEQVEQYRREVSHYAQAVTELESSLGESAYTDYDESPTENSSNLVTSGGVYSEILELDTRITNIVPITTDKLADEAVTSDKLADEAVTEGKIAAGAVTRDSIAQGAIDFTKIDIGAVQGPAIAEGAVTTTAIVDDAVTTAKIDDGAVSSSKLGNNSVTSTKIGNGAVNADKLASSSVTTPKIANNAVTGDKFANGSITSEKLANNAVTGEKIQNDTMSAYKLLPQVTDNDEGAWAGKNIIIRKYIVQNLSVPRGGALQVDNQVIPQYDGFHCVAIGGVSAGGLHGWAPYINVEWIIPNYTGNGITSVTFAIDCAWDQAWGSSDPAACNIDIFLIYQRNFDLDNSKPSVPRYGDVVVNGVGLGTPIENDSSVNGPTFSLPEGTIGTSALDNNVITTEKIEDGAITQNKLKSTFTSAPNESWSSTIGRQVIVVPLNGTTLTMNTTTIIVTYPKPYAFIRDLHITSCYIRPRLATSIPDSPLIPYVIGETADATGVRVGIKYYNETEAVNGNNYDLVVEVSGIL